MEKIRVIDFFCGAGGFSEGFRQMGFEIIQGYDNWKPAVETFNYNFNLNCLPKNILDFDNSIDQINKLPNSEIIIGSPPCVSFSTSNKSGNADKTLGVKLIETYLKIITIKKFQPNSNLKAWFMENVVNSRKYLKKQYSFKDLGLEEWSLKNKLNPSDIAIDLNLNTNIINSADYGSFQSRKRVISGEFINLKRFIIPNTTHNKSGDNGKDKYKNLYLLKSKLPSPFSKKSINNITDPQYPISIPQNMITDHFYDTGVYKTEWKFSKYWKTNHPFMGKMSFPENENNPSRTITATKIANSRESIIYKSEIGKQGDGEYRTPTVREAASIMGFPITYQFFGSENTKWRLVGNAVCCSVSRVLAKEVLLSLNITLPDSLIINKLSNIEGILNLNTYQLKEFNKQPKKNKGSRFRRHAIKDGNLTVTLSNYNIEKNSKVNGKWYTTIQYGTGKDYKIQNIKDNYYKDIKSLINSFENGEKFLHILENKLIKKIANASLNQEMYENQKSIENYIEPTELVDKISEILEKLQIEEKEINQNKENIFKYKSNIPIKQFFALYAINKFSSIVNNN